jgi:putative glutamine amidotransferase
LPHAAAGVSRTVAIVAGCAPPERYSVHRGYVEAVSAVGGVPLIVPAGADVDADAICEAVLSCSAIVLTGGGDVSLGVPTGYGADVALVDPDPGRDAVERQIVLAALGEGRRVLGICRGAQIMTVATGGSLIGDLPSAGRFGHRSGDQLIHAVHRVAAEPGSIAASVLGSLEHVNSIHHQAVADPGPVLRATAWDPEGVIEAVEGAGFLGLQWHPERLVGSDARHLAPFRWAMGG